MARGRQIQSASLRHVAAWRAERVVALAVVKDVNRDFEQLRVALEICRKALPLAAVRCNMEELRVSRDGILEERDQSLFHVQRLAVHQSDAIPRDKIFLSPASVFTDVVHLPLKGL